MADPLAGQRETLNEGGQSLLWPSVDPDTGQPLACPVKPGDTFELRTCRITILRVHRLGRSHDWQWRAEFIRTKRVSKDKIRLLDNRGGYTDDARQAIPIPAQHDSTTVHGVDWRNLDDVEAGQNDGPPLEPEAIDPEIVATLPSSVAARHRYEAVQAERRRSHEELPLEERVRRLRLVGGDDVGRQLARIEESVAAGERKVKRMGRSTEEAA